MKNIKISEELFMSLINYHLYDEFSEAENIKKGINDKLDSMWKHELYTRFKTGESEEEREKARKKYLDEIGMRQSFRW
ncbi:MAG: complexin-2 [Lachnospiraceae bacterium]|nr:complexin-2 [Lachnospiraceae bacterium]